MRDNIRDALHLLQAKEVAKKVPDNMNSVRRIIQFSKVSKDTGSDLEYHTSIPAYVFAAVCCVVVLYVSLILSGVVLWWVVDDNDDEPLPMKKTENEQLLPSTPKSRAHKAKHEIATVDNTRHEIIKEIRQKLEL